VSGGRIAAIIVAGGSGERFGRDGGKQLAEVAGRPVLSWAAEAFGRVPGIDLVVVVGPEQRFLEYREAAIAAVGVTVAVELAASGDTRQASVASGLARVPADVETVVVHDGARPLVTSQLIERALSVLAGDPSADGAIVGHAAVDTIKVVADGAVVETPDRATLWAVQTPQVFRRAALVAAYAAAEADGFLGTDDSSLLERAGARIVLVEGPRENLKVTHAEDLAYVAQVLAQRAGDA